MTKNKKPSSAIILYSSPEGNVKVEVIYSGETFWLTQKRLAESVISKMETSAADGKKYLTFFYNLDAFLQFNEFKILKDAGKVSHEVAKKLAEQEHEKFRLIQDKNFESDFDREVKKLQGKKKK